LLENSKFAIESTRTPLRELTIKKKTFKLTPQNSPIYAILRLKNCPSADFAGEGNTLHSPPSSELHAPNFELALMPL